MRFRVAGGLVVLSCFCCLFASVPAHAAIQSITVDEILFEDNSADDPAVGDLAPSVEMEFNVTTKLLTVILSNEASYSGSPDAGHLLTGLGFNLPAGVAIEDTSGRDSNIWLPSGSVVIDPKADPDGTSGIPLTQDDWGYANNIGGGHFFSLASAGTTTVLSAMHADADMTFGGNVASNALMDSIDYGLQGLNPTPGHSKKRSIRNALGFELYLTGTATTDWDGLVSYVESAPVVVSYGSPGYTSESSTPVPEPGALLVWLALGGIGLATGLRCRCRGLSS